MTRSIRALALGSALALTACGASVPPVETAPPAPPPEARAEAAPAPVKEEPPASGVPRDVRFPPVVRSTTANGIEINAVSLPALPVVYVTLVVKRGSASDPAALPGLAQLTAAMLKEGTRKRSSAALAEAIEFLGARLDVRNDEENVYVEASGLAEHFERVLGLVAEVVLEPKFDAKELGKLKKRELARLQLQSQNPQFLARRALYEALYDKHPYAHIDTTPAVVERVKPSDLSGWHRSHFAPNVSALVVVGAVTPERVSQAASRAFGRWARRNVPETSYPELAHPSERRVVVVDRPASVQSVILIGNLAIERTHPDWISLQVANQVLGGSAASRLFMDLREKRSLTYGAYSSVGEKVRTAPFVAYASVRNDVTAEAMRAFAEHLERIVREPAPADELADAKRYLIDGFPLDIDTPGKIANLITDQRVYGLSDDYWDALRPKIAAVDASQALAAARAHMRPGASVVVVVGKAADVKPALEAYGPVTVVDTDGKLVLPPQSSRSSSPPRR